ncbi:rna-directed dna polymerase from mobile element jockey-like [Willisornis vidua]|uniref:Rna-directed dna polymerase from mobile element jockey-like n=1 Tax=Willisornis vidua TaxID=1566151 RepID=A0ABQ9DMI0_9PASS|nr:rna-directed dna polymerase from mobile element jockey-like [Willisornis vidua]
MESGDSNLQKPVTISSKDIALKESKYCGIECTLTKFADDTRLSGAVDTAEGQDAMQRDQDKPKEYSHGNLMRYNKAKCKVLHLGQGKPLASIQAGQ